MLYASQLRHGDDRCAALDVGRTIATRAIERTYGVHVGRSGVTDRECFEMPMVAVMHGDDGSAAVGGKSGPVVFADRRARE